MTCWGSRRWARFTLSLIALIAGFGAFWRYKEISTGTLSGQTFVGGTVLSCVTGLGIFQHGGFGNPHILAIVTLVVLAVALAAEYLNVFGRVSRHVATSATRFRSSSISYQAPSKR